MSSWALRVFPGGDLPDPLPVGVTPIRAFGPQSHCHTALLSLVFLLIGYSKEEITEPKSLSHPLQQGVAGRQGLVSPAQIDFSPARQVDRDLGSCWPFCP